MAKLGQKSEEEVGFSGESPSLAPTVGLSRVIVWFRKDLRVSDNPALSAAIASGAEVLPIFIWAPEEEREEDGEWSPGGASRWWLHHSLLALGGKLSALGLTLRIYTGPSESTLLSLVRQARVTAVYWSRRYEPSLIRRDKSIKSALTAEGIEAKSFNGSLLHEPWEIQTGSKTPYKVYTPFSKACLKVEVRGLLPDLKVELKLELKVSLAKTEPTSDLPAGIELSELWLLPKINWDSGFKSAWVPGEEGAKRELKRFVESDLFDYHERRNIPSVVGTSRLSPYLAWGELSPNQIWFAVQEKLKRAGVTSQEGSRVYLNEILWREFAYHLLFHFPKTPTKPLREEFSRFPWADNKKLLRCWQRGRTGYPIVDAGMRELWVTGWMHNRVRMIVASFLVKDLLIPWQRGAEWFWDTLVDADLASNTLGWQWTAGCGADAAPFFRVFNPSGQGERFDAEGDYVKRWCPELAKLPAKWIHRPWEAPQEILSRAGVELGVDYPKPVVDHAEMRAEALEAYSSLKAE